jgi:hypothetical protein
MTATLDFASFCADVLGEPISPAWVTFYKAVEGLPLDPDEANLYAQCAGRPYEERVRPEATGICGRRSEKTVTALKFLLWKIQFAGWEKQLRQSWFARLGRFTELLRIPIISQDLRISADAQRAAESLILNSVLENEVADILRNEIVFKNGLSLICLPASKASVRGLTCPACLLDELAWVSIDGASDVELCRQVRPAQIQFGAARRLLKFSTPWQKAGVIFSELSSRDQRPDLLVWQASTAIMTPRIDAAELERERAADPAYYAREYEAMFTDDLESFIPESDIAAAVGGWKELPPTVSGYHVAALDASGLTGGDTFTFAIAHSDKTGATVDVLRGWRRAPVPEVCDEIAGLAKLYRVHKILADQYAYPFLAALMSQRGVELAEQPFSARSKPEIHFALKNALASGSFQIPNHPEAIKELRMLESTRTSGGNYRISAPRGLHDDFVTVLALLAHKISNSHAPRKPFAHVLSVSPDGKRSRWSDQKHPDEGDQRWYHPMN